MKKISKNIKKKEEMKKENIEKKKIKENHNRILKGFFVLICAIIVFMLAFSYFSNKKSEFEYRGIDFRIIDFCDAGPPCLRTYSTKIPIIYQGKPAEYNLYFRNFPEKLEKEVLLNGQLNLKKNLYIDVTFNQYCNGFETIAMDTFLDFSRIAGMNILDGKEIECDLSGKDMHLIIQEATTTEINQIGPSCYELNIKECDIMKGIERLMIEILVEINGTN